MLKAVIHICIGLYLVGCQFTVPEESVNDGLCYIRQNGPNLALDGSFENQKMGEIKEPWTLRPGNRPEQFTMGSTESFDGKNHAVIKAESGDWWGVSQQIALRPGKKYTASFLLRGDSTEVHCGAFNGGNFIGWNNRHVPNSEWQLVSFDFYQREDSDSLTTIYIAAKHPSKKYEYHIDDLQVIVELPNL